jgi:hypothetical protein
MDDAWIGLRSVANLLAGRGLVVNPGERVEGVTNAGWLLLLAPLARLTSPPLAAKLLGLAGLGLAAFLLYKVADRVAPRLAPALVLLLVTDADLLSFSLLGMETGALAAVLAGMLWIAARTTPGRERTVALPFLGALAFLLHPEAVLAYPAAAALTLADPALRTSGLRRGLLPGLGIYAVLLAGITLVRHAYYGAFLPNTWGAKPPTARAVLETLRGFLDGSAVNLGFPFAGLLPLALLAAGYLALRREAPGVAGISGGIAATGLVFAAYARPDWTELGRYFAPYAPAAFLLAGAGALDVERRVVTRAAGGKALRLGGLALAGAALGILLLGVLTVDRGDLARFAAPAGLALVWAIALEAERTGAQRLRGLAAAALALSAALYGDGAAVVRTTEAERLSYPGYILTSATLIPPALWLRDHLPAGAVIATRRIGAVSYFSGHPVFDYSFGLTEPEVARRIRGHGGPFDDPSDPALADLWRRRAPDYLLEESDLVRRLGATNPGGGAGFTIHGMRYRVIRSFPIARGVEWVLAGRTQGGVLSSKEADPPSGR